MNKSLVEEAMGQILKLREQKKRNEKELKEEEKIVKARKETIKDINLKIEELMLDVERGAVQTGLEI